MSNFRTHYDNLKVAENAPSEVIRAAYKILTQKYHPDKNPGDKTAARRMQLINTAYEVLSDPVRRKAHDAWIEVQKEQRLSEQLLKMQAAAQANIRAAEEQKKNRASPPPTNAPIKTKSWHGRRGSLLNRALLVLLIPVAVIAHVFRHFVLYCIGVFLTAVVVDGVTKKFGSNDRYAARSEYSNLKPASSPSAPGKQSLTVKANPPMCVAMLTGPGGAGWPSAAGYIKGERFSANKGLSNLTVDNSQGGSPIYVKLKTTAGGQAVRSVYIPAGRQFTMKKIDKGAYQMFYKDIVSGCNSKSDFFTLDERDVSNGTQFTNATMTIHKVVHGNMNYQNVAEVEF